MMAGSGTNRQDARGWYPLAGALLAALFALAGCSKDAVDEQKVEAHRGRAGMNPGMSMAPQASYPAPGYGAALAPQVPAGGGQGRYVPPGYAAPYPSVPGQVQPPAGGAGYPGWQSQGTGVAGWSQPHAGSPATGYAGQGYGNPGRTGAATDWALQGQQRNNPWAGAGATGWQSPATPVWNTPQTPRYRPLDEDEKERARRGSNPWVAPYDRPIGSSHSEQPSPPTVPGLVSPGVVNPYGFGVYAPGLYGTGLPTLGYYPGVPGVLGPWGW